MRRRSRLRLPRLRVMDDAGGLGDGFGTMPFKAPGLHRRNYFRRCYWIVWYSFSKKQTIGRVVGSAAGTSFESSVWQANKLALLLSRRQDQTEMLQRVRVLYGRLPEWIRQAGAIRRQS